MSTLPISPLSGNDHDTASGFEGHERSARWVVVLAVTMMVAELVVGRWTGSLALTADGWHMATHAGALGLTALAYRFARTRATHHAFTFGTGKVYALAGYTSAVALAMVALWMVSESVTRLVHPEPVRFQEALPVAVIGLLVNIVSAKLLDHDHDHDHDHEEHEHEEHDHPDEQHDHRPAAPHGHGDHNLRAAYVHVLADALTSVLAIAALLAGRFAGWTFLDPMMGLIGAAVILVWSVGLCRSAAAQLLDVVPSPSLVSSIRCAIEAVDDARVLDLHVWELGPAKHSCIVSLVATSPRATSHYREVLLRDARLTHVTVEVHRADEHPTMAVAS